MSEIDLYSEIEKSNNIRSGDQEFEQTWDGTKSTIGYPTTFFDDVVNVAGDIVEGAGDLVTGTAKGMPMGASKAGTEIMDTLTGQWYSTVAVPWMNENIPGLKDINESVNKAIKPEGTAQEVGAMIGEVGTQIVLPGAMVTKSLHGANIGSRFLTNVLGYGSTEALVIPAKDQGLIESAITFLAQDDEATKALLETLEADEDLPYLLQKLQRTPLLMLEGGVIGESISEGLNALIKYGKNSPMLTSLKTGIKTKFQNIGEKAQQRLDQDTGGVTLSAMGGGEIDKVIDKTLAKFAPARGIPFDKTVTDKNVRLHKMRLDKVKQGVPYPGGPKNERTVIKAPNDSLPDFVVGKITFDDWIKRTEKLLTKEEIMTEKDWYDDVFKEFDKLAGEDQTTLRKIGEAWLSAQQNETPATAMTNVLFIFEQFKRGVPRSEVKGKGLPSANKIASDIIYGEKITGGAGQKISDFIDSGYGKSTRSIMGNSPDGGSPFVVDVHTARDTGLVDRKLVNHLKRLGYEVPDNIILDVGEGGIKGPMYENRAVFGRELTEHLNSISWQGKNDWTPQEVQAVGWMALSNKLTGEGGRGGNTATAMTRNTRRISMEVDPGEGSPFATKFGEDYANLDDANKFDINQKVTEKAINFVNKEEGLNLNYNVHGTGGWELYQNPSTVSQVISSREGAVKAGAKLGYLLNQTEVWVNTAKEITKNPQNYGVDIIETGTTKNLRNSEDLKSLFEKIVDTDKNGLFRGYQPIVVDGQPGIRIIIDNEAIKGSPLTKAQAQEYIQKFASTDGDLSKILANLNYDVKTATHEIELTKLRNDWKENPNGESYRSYFSDESRTTTKGGTGSNIDNFGSELENFFGEEITKAKGDSRTNRGADDTPGLGGDQDG